MVVGLFSLGSVVVKLFITVGSAFIIARSTNA